MMTQRRLTLTAMPLAAVLMGGFACDRQALTSPTSPSSAAPVQTGVIEGEVFSFSPSCVKCGRNPLFGARAEVILGTSVGMSTTTDDRGVYRLELPPGQVRIRLSKPGHSTEFVDPVVEAGYRTIAPARDLMPPMTPFPPPAEEWSVVGTVTDDSGAAVPGASVSATELESTSFYGSAFTDATGRFRIVSMRTRIEGRNVISFQQTGFVTQRISFPCCGSREVNVDVRPPRILGVRLVGPESLLVTQWAPIAAEVRFSNGTTTSLVPSFLFTSEHLRNSRRGSGVVEGVKPGPGSVSWTYYGVNAMLQIRVDP